MAPSLAVAVADGLFEIVCLLLGDSDDVLEIALDAVAIADYSIRFASHPATIGYRSAIATDDLVGSLKNAPSSAAFLWEVPGGEYHYVFSHCAYYIKFGSADANRQVKDLI